MDLGTFLGLVRACVCFSCAPAVPAAANRLHPHVGAAAVVAAAVTAARVGANGSSSAGAASGRVWLQLVAYLQVWPACSFSIPC
jgi:hypothetical protein